MPKTFTPFITSFSSLHTTLPHFILILHIIFTSNTFFIHTPSLPLPIIFPLTTLPHFISILHIIFTSNTFFIHTPSLPLPIIFPLIFSIIFKLPHLQVALKIYPKTYSFSDQWHSKYVRKPYFKMIFLFN